MANLVIVSTTNAIKVDFGVLGVLPLPKKGTWKKDHIIKITLIPSDAYVTVITDTDPPWYLSYNGTNGLQVDSIDGSAPSSNSDLYDKLIALMI